MQPRVGAERPTGSVEMSGAFPRHFLLRFDTRQRAPTFSGPGNTRSACIHLSDRETSVYSITFSVPGENPSQNRMVLRTHSECVGHPHLAVRCCLSPVTDG